MCSTGWAARLPMEIQGTEHVLETKRMEDGAMPTILGFLSPRRRQGS